MGSSWSSRRARRHNYHHQNHLPFHHSPPFFSPRPPPPPPSSLPAPFAAPPPPNLHSSVSPPPQYSYPASVPFPQSCHPPYSVLPPPSPPPHVLFRNQNSTPHSFPTYAPAPSAQVPYFSHAPAPSAQFPYFSHPPSEGPGSSGSSSPPPYVDRQGAKRIKNEVNVRKDSIKILQDDTDYGSYLVSFTFDALADGSITIFYFAKEVGRCTFTSLYPDLYKSMKIQFEKGLGRKFVQSTGSGIDLGFFDENDLLNPSPDCDTFPLVILLESQSPLTFGDGAGEPKPSHLHAQITQAVLKRDGEGCFLVRVIKQILWVDDVRYDLREIYGIGGLDKATVEDDESAKECVICMTEPKDTAIMPCRHMCLCSGCAKELRIQSNKCPICRHPIEALLEIEANRS